MDEIWVCKTVKERFYRIRTDNDVGRWCKKGDNYKPGPECTESF